MTDYGRGSACDVWGALSPAPGLAIDPGRSLARQTGTLAIDVDAGWTDNGHAGRGLLGTDNRRTRQPTWILGVSDWINESVSRATRKASALRPTRQRSARSLRCPETSRPIGPSLSIGRRSGLGSRRASYLVAPSLAREGVEVTGSVGRVIESLDRGFVKTWGMTTSQPLKYRWGQAFAARALLKRPVWERE